MTNKHRQAYDIDKTTTSAKQPGLTSEVVAQNKTKTILLYYPIIHLGSRGVHTYKLLQTCPVKNCQVVFNKHEADRSDAVIFHLWIIAEKHHALKFKRPHGQIWIIDQHEPPPVYYKLSNVNEVCRSSGEIL